jgi:hypothetical protein
VTASESLQLNEKTVLRSVLEEVPCTNCGGKGKLKDMYDSKAQMKFAHTPTGKRKFGLRNVAEFDEATKGKSDALPEHVSDKKKKMGRRFITPAKEQ